MFVGVGVEVKTMTKVRGSSDASLVLVVVGVGVEVKTMTKVRGRSDSSLSSATPTPTTTIRSYYPISLLTY